MLCLVVGYAAATVWIRSVAGRLGDAFGQVLNITDKVGGLSTEDLPPGSRVIAGSEPVGELQSFTTIQISAQQPESLSLWIGTWENTPTARRTREDTGLVGTLEVTPTKGEHTLIRLVARETLLGKRITGFLWLQPVSRVRPVYR